MKPLCLRPQARRRVGERFAFTLIELLVVVTIIALLAAILFPVFGRARENARRSTCQSNLKQIGMGTLQYIQDYDERFPLTIDNNGSNGSDCYADDPGTTCITGNPWRLNWAWAIQPYIRSWQVFRCPSAVTAPNGSPTPIRAPQGNSNNSYLANGVIIPVGGGSRSFTTVQKPATLIWIHEDNFGSHRAFVRLYYASNAYHEWLNVGTPGYDSQHFEGGNLLFVDGHVKWRKTISISSREFGLDADLIGPQSSSAVVSYRDFAQVS